jgi:hypothetical protein
MLGPRVPYCTNRCVVPHGQARSRRPPRRRRRARRSARLARRARRPRWTRSGAPLAPRRRRATASCAAGLRRRMPGGAQGAQGMWGVHLAHARCLQRMGERVRCGGARQRMSTQSKMCANIPSHTVSFLQQSCSHLPGAWLEAAGRGRQGPLEQQFLLAAVRALTGDMPRAPAATAHTRAGQRARLPTLRSRAG